VERLNEVSEGFRLLVKELGVPVIGLCASAPSYYGAVGARLGARMILPEHAGVANAIGAPVPQVAKTPVSITALPHSSAAVVCHSIGLGFSDSEFR
jgi:hypothetical protein